MLGRKLLGNCAILPCNLLQREYSAYTNKKLLFYHLYLVIKPTALHPNDNACVNTNWEKYEEWMNKNTGVVK